jgi:hypothetical protein
VRSVSPALTTYGFGGLPAAAASSGERKLASVRLEALQGMGQARGEAPTDQRLLDVHPAPEWCRRIARGAAADIAPAEAVARILRLDNIAFAPVEIVTPLLRTQVALNRRMSAARRRHSVALARLSLVVARLITRETIDGLELSTGSNTEQELRRLRRIFVRDNVRGDYDPLAGPHVINFTGEPMHDSDRIAAGCEWAVRRTVDGEPPST